LLQGVTRLLTDQGHLVVENAYLLSTIENNQFDQIYHEHMFYYCVQSMRRLLEEHGMCLVDALLAPVHGGSIVYIAKKAHRLGAARPSVRDHEAQEHIRLTPEAFRRFASNALGIKEQLRALVSEIRASGRSIYTYGATAKGNTLLNFVGLSVEDIPYCVDSTGVKQGRYLPKSNIKVISEEDALKMPPDYFLLTAWNYKDEIIAKVRRSGNTHSGFLVPIPRVELIA
jgi:hypothetical protein